MRTEAISMLLLVFFAACSTTGSGGLPEGAATVDVTRVGYFDSAADGLPVRVEVGTYHLVPEGENAMRLLPSGEGSEISVAALVGSHDDEFATPHALFADEGRDGVHLVLLRPDGTTLDAIGSQSEVRTRGFSRRLFSRKKYSKKYTKYKKPPAPAKKYSVGVTKAKPKIIVTAPASNASLNQGRSYTIRWTVSPLTSIIGYVNVTLHDSKVTGTGEMPAVLTIARGLRNHGRATFKVPEKFKTGRYYFRVSKSDDPYLYGARDVEIVPTASRFVRLELSSLYCKKTTGETSSDEPFVTGSVLDSSGMKPLNLPFGRATFTSIDDGEFVISPTNPRLLWQGWLRPGELVMIFASVIESDSGYGGYKAAYEMARTGIEIAQNAPGAVAGDPVSIMRLANAGFDAIDQVAGILGGGASDPVGGFVLVVRNEGGDVKKVLTVTHNKDVLKGFSPRSRIVNLNSYPPLIRTLHQSYKNSDVYAVHMRLAPELEYVDKHPEEYYAAIRITDLETGKALKWKRKKERAR